MRHCCCARLMKMDQHETKSLSLFSVYNLHLVSVVLKIAKQIIFNIQSECNNNFNTIDFVANKFGFTKILIYLPVMQPILLSHLYTEHTIPTYV